MDEYAYVVNVEGAVARDGRYLLIERAAAEDHAPGVLAFPGGKVETQPGGSSPVEATVRRELEEELGIAVGRVDYVTSGVFEADTGHHVINIITYCEDLGDTPTIRDPAEVAGVQWLTPTAIEDHPDAPPFLESYIDAIETYRREVRP